tara:strand:- start:1900 stop:2862 length:963 start_codon:yes stop_codon:yes gene_type:complete
MNKLHLLIVGSNFGRYHLNSSLKSKKFKNISIASPNIYEKKIPKEIHKFKNFKIAIKNTKFDMITIATKPKIQNDVLKFLYKNKIFPRFIFLEKPILDKTIKIIKKFPNKSKILTNFIFTFDKKWSYFKKNININKLNYTFDYYWFFKQAYFENSKQTWKIDPSQGGGLVNYYLPHAIFNILYIFKNVKLLKINKKKYYKNILVYLELSFLHSGNISILKISNKSKINLHKLKIVNRSDDNNYEIFNKTKKWLSNFKILNNTKEINKLKKEIVTGDGREEVLQNVYSNLESYFLSKHVDTNKSLTYKTFSLIKIINSKIR